jgi:uncharacterized protein
VIVSHGARHGLSSVLQDATRSSSTYSPRQHILYTRAECSRPYRLPHGQRHYTFLFFIVFIGKMAFRVLEAMGLNQEKDIRRERLDPGKSNDATKDRKLDAYFWVGGIPTSAVTDLGATPGTKLKLIDHADAVDAMNQKYGQIYVRDTIPAKSYPGQDRPNQVVTVWNLIVARADMPDQMAYTIVKTILDKRDELIQVHKEAQNFDLEHQTKAASPIPYHPGAVQYFGERGIKLN